MVELGKIFLLALEKVIPSKYQGFAILVIIVILITLAANNWYHAEKSDNKELKQEIKQELKEMNKHMEDMDKRLQRVEVITFKTDSTSRFMSYDILSIKVDNNTNYHKLLDVMLKGFKVTKEELIRLHTSERSTLTTRFDDFDSYINSIANDTSRRIIVIQPK